MDNTGSHYMTVAKFAQEVGVTPDTVRRWIREHRIAGKAIGGKRAGYRIPVRELTRLLEPEEEVAV